MGRYDDLDDFFQAQIARIKRLNSQTRYGAVGSKKPTLDQQELGSVDWGVVNLTSEPPIGYNSNNG